MALHAKVIALANHYGVELADRSSYNYHVYDGRAISLRTWKRVFSDHDVLHEIVHFVIATPEQRDLPEYGLGSVAIGGEDYVPNVVDLGEIEEEATIQEFMATFLTIKWGKAYGIPVHFSSTLESMFTSWQYYLKYKITEYSDTRSPKWYEYAWVALIRLKERGLLDSLPIPRKRIIK